MKPSLAIVNFNGAANLPEVLTAACALADRFAEIMLVDNASTDESVALTARDFPAVRIVRRADNPGPGAARNTAVREAASDLILLMDNDVTLTAECVDRLVEALRAHPRAVLAAPAIVYAHRRDLVQYDGAHCHFLGLQTLLDEDVPLAQVPAEVRRVGSMVSCAFLLDRARLPAAEGFDESFFIYFEDHDFGVRLCALGLEVLSVPLARCYHGKGTEGLSIRQTGKYTPRRVFFLIRNRWLFILKNYSARTLLVLAPVLAFYELAQLGVTVKKGWLGEWVRAVGWTVRHLPQVLRERRRIQRARRVPDRELLVGGRIPFRAELAAGKLERAAQGALNAVALGYWKLTGRLI